MEHIIAESIAAPPAAGEGHLSHVIDVAPPEGIGAHVEPKPTAKVSGGPLVLSVLPGAGVRVKSPEIKLAPVGTQLTAREPVGIPVGSDFLHRSLEQGGSSLRLAAEFHDER